VCPEGPPEVVQIFFGLEHFEQLEVGFLCTTANDGKFEDKKKTIPKCAQR
jgi:hypothetical protein